MSNCNGGAEPVGFVAPKGLEGVVVDETAISQVDGDAGQLVLRGRSIDDVVAGSFGAAAELVIRGTDGSLDDALIHAAPLSDRELSLVLRLPAETHPMHLLQGLTVLLDAPNAVPEPLRTYGPAAPGLAIAAKLPQLVATHLARRALPYPSSGSFLERFLAQLGAPEATARPFEITQILQLEHSFNAGTFAARVVASTEAPVQNCLAAAFGALHGRLHGGADQAALETADEVGDPARAAAFVDECLATGRKVMGMGHREYKVVDPRSRHVQLLAEQLTRGTEHERTFATLQAIEARFRERMAERGKALHANLEFYKGLVYRSVGLPTRFFTATFALARVFGYVAHFVENAQDNRLIRPAARYVGPRLVAAAGEPSEQP